MEYLYFLIVLIIVFRITKWYYYEKGFEIGIKESSKHYGWSIRNSADWFNENNPEIGNALFEIGSQIIAYGSFRIESVRDLIKMQGQNRYHENVEKYTKPSKDGL